MDRVEHVLLSVLMAVSRALDPVATGLGRLNFTIHTQLSFFAIPLAWHDPIVIGLWVIVLFMLFRILSGWLRLAMLICTILVVAKIWGYLPA